MPTSVTDIQKWQPLAVAQISGALQQAGSGITQVANVLNGIVKTGAAIVKVAAALLPATTDPALLALNTAIGIAQQLLKDFSGIDAACNMLIVPPIIGSNDKFFSFISQKLNDEKDLYRPPVDVLPTPSDPTNSVQYEHAGIIVWASLNTPSGIIELYRAMQRLFGPNQKTPSNATGLNTFRPKLTVALVYGKPMLTWEGPHSLDILRGQVHVRDTSGQVYSSITGIQEVVIWRRKASKSALVEEKIAQQAYSPFAQTFVDQGITEGTVEYAVDFDYKLQNGLMISGVRSNWARLDITKKKTKKNFSVGGQFPQFMGFEAKYTIEGLEVSVQKLQQFLERMKAASSSFKKEVDSYADFIVKQVDILVTEINNLVSIIIRIAADLDAITRSGLFFVGYEGKPLEAVQSLIGSSGASSASNINCGIMINMASSNLTLARLAIDSIKKLCGWGGELRALDALATAAKNIGNSAVSAFENVKQSSKLVQTNITDLGNIIK